MAGNDPRLFVAVDIPYPAYANRVIEVLALNGIGLQAVPPSNSHITIRFLGETPSHMLPGIRAALSRALEKVRPFVICLRGMGCFGPPGSPRVLWAGIIDQGELARVSRAVNRSLTDLGIASDTRPFRAHLTLARFKTAGKGPQRLDSGQMAVLIEELARSKDIEMGMCQIDRVVLKRSLLRKGGAVYHDEAVFSLGH